MSCHAELINNSINDNKVNNKKMKSSPIHQIKKLIKCVLKKNNKVSSFDKCHQQHDYFFDDDEINDNLANEILENEIFEEIDVCDDFAAVPVYENGAMQIHQVTRGQRFIPVHFARTDAGTFFWTSITGPDSDISYHGDKNAICNYQTPEIQVPCDRWAQA